MADNLRLESSTTPQLSGLQVWIVQGVANQLSVDEMASRLTEYGDEDYSSDTVRNVVKGLCGVKKRVPKKYHVEERYLKQVPRHPDNSINYDVTQKGRGLLASIDTPPNLRVLTGSDNSLEDSMSELGLVKAESKIRPHKCWWRERIKRKPSGEAQGLSWDQRRTVLAEKEIPWEEYDKEIPGREQSQRGELIQYKGWNVILFENTILIRYDRPVQTDSVFEVLDDWWETRNEIVEWVQSEFPVLLRSRPLDVTMPLSTQEWGDVENCFAEWIRDNPEFQDDSPNSLFEVQNDRGERIFHIDTSPTDGLGNDLAEGEFPHSQFGAEHIVNLKQAVKWMATLGVKPQDFQASIWTRNNRDELEKLVEFDSEELEARVDELESAIGSVARDASEKREVLWSAVDDVDRRVSGVEARVGDAVRRVDATREEFQRKHGVLSEAVQSNHEVGQEIAETLAHVNNRMEGRDQALLDQIQGLQQKTRLQNRDYRQGQREVVQELQELKQLQRRTVVEKMVEEVKAFGGLVRSGVSSLMERWPF